RNAELQDLEALPGVYFTAAREKLEQLVTEMEVSARYFIGYSGWGGGQLESELAGGAWAITAASIQSVFRDHDQMWETISREAGGPCLLSSLGIKHVPPAPRLN